MSLAAMKQALEALLEHGSAYLGHDLAYKSAITVLRAAIEHAERPQTHSEECWRWHHKCAIAKIERGNK